MTHKDICTSSQLGRLINTFNYLYFVYTINMLQYGGGSRKAIKFVSAKY